MEYFKGTYPVSHLCKVLKVTRAAYYQWKKRRPSKRQLENEALMNDIKNIYDKYEGIYGYRRIYIYIRFYLKKKVNRKRIQRLMKKLGLKSVIRRKRNNYAPHVPKITTSNVLNRNFKAERPNQKWLTDITEFRLSTDEKLYLSAIYDLNTCKIISYEISNKNNNDLVINTFNKAVKGMSPKETKGLLFHSDRGTQYTSQTFNTLINKYHMIHSMSRVKMCIDNGPMEGVWGLMKSELLLGDKKRRLPNYEEAEKMIREYITFFNNERVSLKMSSLAG
ncbi:IS3 family transposase [Staphylococcus delphini]|uniref:IS3 family transposase n=1 Tax=Staphylococcus delphini TaxID=53344 RepID=UPI0029622EF8|nr:IS3 family transposase [Staphylococcus delphini]